jgi:diguanylate cyclase (GGDEF)-like protein
MKTKEISIDLNKKLRKLRLILFILLFFTFTFSVIAFFISSAKGNLYSTGYQLDKNWTVTINGREYENVDLNKFSFKSVNKGDYVIYSRYLPENYNYSGKELDLYRIHASTKVLINGQTRYKYGLDEAKNNIPVGYGFDRVLLRNGDSGKLLIIDLYVSEDDAFTALTIPVIINIFDYTNLFLSPRVIVLVLSVTLIVFGGVIAVIAAVLAISRKERGVNYWKLIWLGFFSFFGGVYSLYSSDCFVLFFNNMASRPYLEFISLYLEPVFFMGYIHEEVNYGRKKLRRFFYNIIVILLLAFFALLITGLITNTIHPANLLKENHFLDLVVVIYAVAVYYKDWRSEEGKSAILLAGVCVIAIFAVEEVLRFNITKYVLSFHAGSYSNQLYFAVFIFVVFLLVDYVKETVYKLYNNAKLKMMEKFAFTDSLTEIGNRRAVEEYFDNVDKKEIPYCVMEFDLNNLKKINDSQGHNEGDQYIRAFADVLKAAFNGKGFLGRSGGDEFVAVLTKDSLKISNVNAILDSIAENVAKQNQKHPGWEMSAAAGYYYSDEPGINNIRNAYRIADSRMYANKKNMKVGR